MFRYSDLCFMKSVFFFFYISGILKVPTVNASSQSNSAKNISENLRLKPETAVKLGKITPISLGGRVPR